MNLLFTIQKVGLYTSKHLYICLYATYIQSKCKGQNIKNNYGISISSLYQVCFHLKDKCGTFWSL